MGTRAEFVNSIYQAGLAAGLTDAAARVMAAQAAHESAFGDKAPGNNFFGIKAGKGWAGPTQNLTTHEVENGKRIKTKAKFRAYDTPEEAIADRVAFMADKFPAFNTAPDVGTALDALQDGKFGKYYTDSRSDYEGSINVINSKYLGGNPVPPGSIPTVASQTDTAPGGSYTVQRGDTLGKIAKQAGTTVDALAKANGIRDPNKIQAGAKLVIPGQGSAKPTTHRQSTEPPMLVRARSLGTLPPSSAPLNPEMPPRASNWTEKGPNVQQASLRSLGADFQPLPAPAPLRPQAGPQQPAQRTASAPVPMALLADRRPVLEPASKVLGDGKVQLPRPRPQVASLTPRTITGEEPATGGFGGFLGGIGSNLQALGGNVMEGARTLGQKAGEVTETVGAKIEEGARAMVPEMLRTVEGRTALLDPMISNIGTDQPLKYANIKRKRAEVQANRQKTGVASQVSTSPGNNQTFTGSSGRTYTVGKTYSNAKGSFIAQPGGKFTPVPAKAPVQTNQLAINPNLGGRTDRFANTVDQFGMVI